jgi:hypothetical protein
MDDKLRKALDRDNDLEARGMHGDDRETCWAHRTWAVDCEDLHGPSFEERLAAQRAERDARPRI